MEVEYFTQTRPEMAAFLPPVDGRVLEIGCGAGGFTRSHLSGAAEKWGIEPFEPVTKSADKIFDRLLIGTFDQVKDQLPRNHFNLVVCNDVIEHMNDHDAFLEEISSYMRPGGYLVGSVPNVRHITALMKLLVGRDWPYKDDGILDRTHLRFFTERSLNRALRTASFDVEKISGVRSVIAEGVTGLSTAKNLVVRGLTGAIVVGTLGWWSDVQYPQIAWRAKLTK